MANVDVQREPDHNALHSDAMPVHQWFSIILFTISTAKLVSNFYMKFRLTTTKQRSSIASVRNFVTVIFNYHALN